MDLAYNGEASGSESQLFLPTTDLNETQHPSISTYSYSGTRRDNDSCS